jgi:hypothetical protein
MSDFVEWLRGVTGGGSDDSSGEIDLDLFDPGPAYSDEDFFDFEQDVSEIFNLNGSTDAFDIFNPEYYPRSEDNPSGYDPNAPFNLPIESGDAKKVWEFLKKLPKKTVDFLKNNKELAALIFGGAGAYLGSQDVRKPSGGGVAYGYVGPESQLIRTIESTPSGGKIARYTQGPPSAAPAAPSPAAPAPAAPAPAAPDDQGDDLLRPQVQDQWGRSPSHPDYGKPISLAHSSPPASGSTAFPDVTAAKGGIMHAYANGGKVVPMQDGGFVMTKRAVDGAGGPRGIQALVPQARMIRGPGHGTSDSIPAYIQGPNGRTPARVSNGEAYVPPGNDTQKLYALMKALERRA